MSSNELQGYKKTLNSPYTGIKGWIDSRLPLIRMMEAEYLKFPVPKSLNYFWSVSYTHLTLPTMIRV